MPPARTRLPPASTSSVPRQASSGPRAGERDRDRRPVAQPEELRDEPARRLLELDVGGQHVRLRLEPKLERERAGAILPVDGELGPERILP